MPASVPENLLFSLLGLLKGSLVVFIPVFILVLTGKALRKKIQSKTKWKWFPSALASTFILVWMLILIAYFVPFLEGLSEQSLGEIPASFAPPPAAILYSYVYGLARVTISAAVVCLILMPLEFAGLFVFESLSKRFPKSPEWIRLLATSYIAALFSSAVFLFIIPEAVTGLLFFIYFG